MQKLPYIEKLLTFELNQTLIQSGNEVSWIAQPMWTFTPLGLIIWGATDKTFVHSIHCGNQSQADAASSVIPARFFEQGRSFEEIEKLAEKGELHLSVAQRQKLRMGTCSLGVRFCVTTQGPFENMVVWGVVHNQDVMPAFAEIVKVVEPASGEHGSSNLGKTFHRGRIVTPTIDGGEFEQLVVEAPTASDCAVMMAPQLSETGIRKLRW